MKSEIGLIGLGVMGRNLAFNIASKGFNISVYNRSPSKVIETENLSKKENLNKNMLFFKEQTTSSNENEDKLIGLKSFINSIEKPRKIILLIKAGPPVDKVLNNLCPLLNKNDLIIDGGNEWFHNTERRIKECKEKYNLKYIGMGVSGGEEGARFGPSLMPGGDYEGYKSIEHILTKISAQIPKKNDKNQFDPCVTYIGKGGSGNYVKMVHNGIEYGDMQLIVEIYDLMKKIGGFSNIEMSNIFQEWNNSELKSFLIEITSKILKKKDDKKGFENDFLIDKILDRSGSKGTGKWTIQEAAERGISCPTISSALDARYISSIIDQREKASQQFKNSIKPKIKKFENENEKKQFIQDLKNCLYCSKICSYSQGMSLLKQASNDFNFNLDFGKIAKIWRGGCIIRAVFLDRIHDAFKNNKNLQNLLMDKSFSKEILEREKSWRKIVGLAFMNGVPIPSLSSSLNYFDSYKSKRLPANLIQGQRDFFGAHTFQRIDEDKKQFFHAKWY